MTQRRYLILGGTGFVGAALSHRLTRDGHLVCLPSRNPERRPDLRVVPGARLLAADVHDPVELNRLVAGADAVINLVGILNEAGRKGDGFRQVHTELTAKVIDACHRHGVRRLVHMSSLQAAVDAPSHYLRSKGAAERLLRERASGIQWTVFRPSVIFGSGDSLTRRFAALLKFVPVLPLARAHARFAPAHVDDVVEAIVRSIDLPQSHGVVYELGGPDTMTLAELVRTVARLTGRRRLVFGIPDWAGRCQAAVFERLPGKLLSTDNFNSLGLPSVPQSDGFSALGIRPASLFAVAPHYLTTGVPAGAFRA